MGSIEKAKYWKKAQGAGVGEGKRERGGKDSGEGKITFGMMRELGKFSFFE